MTKKENNIIIRNKHRTVGGQNVIAIIPNLFVNYSAAVCRMPFAVLTFAI